MSFIDHTHPDVVAEARLVTEGCGTDTERAVALFHHVRDGWRYDPYDISTDPADYLASAILGSDHGWCVTKSILLCALLRAVGVGARLGYADVKNHLQTPKLREAMGSDVFAYHGYVEVELDGRTFKVSTAFNIELCDRFGVKVLEFDGTSDALMHPFDTAGNRHMEYIRERGTFDDVPLTEMLATFEEMYDMDRLTGRDEVFHG